MKLAFINTGKLLLFIYLVFNFNTVEAQTRDYGEVDETEFTRYNAEYDSTMPAVVLFDKGIVSFDNNLDCFLEVHRRIKILNDDGLEYGEVEIYLNEDTNQSVSGIKAATYTLLPNGKIEEKRLGRREVYTTEYSDDVSLKKFSLPNIQPGSIIEYKYRKRMGNPFMLPDWQFHDFIPVQWSELTMYIPVELQYRMIFKGNDPLFINESESGLFYGQQSVRYYFVKNDLPAVEDLPFLINRSDHLSSLRTQLIGTRFPGAAPQSFFKSWNDIAEEINEISDFGKQRLNGDMKKKVDELIAGSTTDLAKIERIYNFVALHYNWDGTHRVLTEQGIRDTFENQTGSTSDINLMLIEMLRYAEIEASPALISTRTNGNIITDFPLINQFNMVIAAIELEDGAFIIDASSGKRSYRSPHPKVLFRQALVVRKDDSHGWITTMPIDVADERTVLEIELTDSSLIHLNISGTAKGMFSEIYRDEVDSLKQKEYWEDLLEEYNSLEVDSASFSNLDSLGASVNYMVQLQMDAGSDLQRQGDLIYLNPFLFLKRERNPFVKQTRIFPVEFSFPYSEKKIVSLNIPDGYEVDEIPESIQVSLPERSGLYRFVSQATSDKVILASTFSLNAVYFYPEEYENLKMLYQKMVDTQTAMIVLKKKESAVDLGE